MVLDVDGKAKIFGELWEKDLSAFRAERRLRGAELELGLVVDEHLNETIERGADAPVI